MGTRDLQEQIMAGLGERALSITELALELGHVTAPQPTGEFRSTVLTLLDAGVLELTADRKLRRRATDRG